MSDPAGPIGRARQAAHQHRRHTGLGPVAVHGDELGRGNSGAGEELQGASLGIRDVRVLQHRVGPHVAAQHDAADRSIAAANLQAVHRRGRAALHGVRRDDGAGHGATGPGQRPGRRSRTQQQTRRLVVVESVRHVPIIADAVAACRTGFTGTYTCRSAVGVNFAFSQAADGWCTASSAAQTASLS